MWNRIKQLFSKVWQKVKPYAGYIAAFIGGLIGLVILGKKSDTKASEVLQEQQDKREEKANEILQNADKSIEDYYKNKQNRGL